MRSGLRGLFRPLPWWTPVLGALVISALMQGAYQWTDRHWMEFRQSAPKLGKAAEQTAAADEHYDSLAVLKTLDVEQFKAGLSDLTTSRRTLYEGGLALQEERRLLEKQIEIMTTYMILNPALQRIFLFRGDQVLQSYLISYIPIREFGGVPATLPNTVRIVSKERFAHPERGSSEVINGNLQWTPPQVGSSVRASALGEFVMFTNSKLILHGPPLNDEAHENYPHLCIGLDLNGARKLYRSSFIGTKIVISSRSRG